MNAKWIPFLICFAACMLMGCMDQGYEEASDGINEHMELGRFAFHPERTMYVGETNFVVASISGMEISEENLTESLSKYGYGDVAVEDINISRYMEVQLVGSKFGITPIGKETKLVRENHTTEWKWEVVPNEEGTQSLVLTAIALVEYPPGSGSWISSGEESTVISRNITVLAKEKPMSEAVSSFLKENWQYLLSTLIIPVFLWYWKRRDQNKPKPTSIHEHTDTSKPEHPSPTEPPGPSGGND